MTLITPSGARNCAAWAITGSRIRSEPRISLCGSSASSGPWSENWARNRPVLRLSTSPTATMPPSSMRTSPRLYPETDTRVPPLIVIVVISRNTGPPTRKGHANE